MGASLAIPWSLRKLGDTACHLIPIWTATDVVRQDVEMVEMPKRAFPAKPGMPLFGALHQKTEAFQNFAAPRCVKHEECSRRFFRLGIFFCFFFSRLKKSPVAFLLFGVGWGGGL